MSKKNDPTVTEKNDTDTECSCSLCGQLYNNFSFKGGYICEDCLNAIKDQDQSPDKPEEDT